MDPYLITTLVGLICNFRAERGAREALNHQEFIEWLEYHRHEDLKNLIANQAALRTEVDNILRSDMQTTMHKLDDISKILVSIMARLDDFKGLAATVPAQSQLSPQATSILVQFVKAGGNTLYCVDLGGGNWALQADIHFALHRVTSLLKKRPRPKQLANTKSDSDWQSVRKDGSRILDVRLNLKTDDGAIICMTYKGLRLGPPDVIARLEKGEVADRQATISGLTRCSRPPLRSMLG